MIIPVLLIVGGTWITQDAIASLLYYWGKEGQSWHFDQLERCFRGLFGIMFIVLGIILLRGIAGR